MSFDEIRRAQLKMAEKEGAALGSLLWWSLSSNRIEHDALKSLARKHQLDEKYLPHELKATQAFRRAWRHASTKLKPGLMLRPIAETEQELVVGLVRERADSATRDLDYDLLTRVSFNKDTETISADDNNGILLRIRDLFAYHQAHTTPDLRSMLTNFLNEAGIRLRESGGVYFVPASHQKTLTALCAVVEEAGHNTAYLLPMVDSVAGKETLRAVAKKSLGDEIRQLQEELDKFDPDKVRESTLERKLQGFEDLRARVQLFSRVLSFRATDMSNKISQIQNTLRSQISDASPNSSAQDMAKASKPLETNKPSSLHLAQSRQPKSQTANLAQVSGKNKSSISSQSFEPYSAAVGF